MNALLCQHLLVSTLLSHLRSAGSPLPCLLPAAVLTEMKEAQEVGSPCERKIPPCATQLAHTAIIFLLVVAGNVQLMLPVTPPP